jgi:hypothetical protein
MTNLTINGHDAHHALQEMRRAKTELGVALSNAKHYLKIAQSTNLHHSLGYDIPSSREIAAALDSVTKSLHP